MVEFNSADDTVKRVVPYPKGFRPWDHSLCLFQESTLVIADGKNGAVVAFNADSKKYGQLIAIEKVGSFCSVIAVGDTVLHLGGGGGALLESGRTELEIVGARSVCQRCS